MFFTMLCPSCESVLDLHDEEKTHRVCCPRCGARFIANDPGLSPAQVEELRRRELDRRRGGQRTSRPDRVRLEVDGPVTALRVHGWFTLVCGTLLAGLGVLFAVVLADDAQFLKAEKTTREETLLVAAIQLAQGLCAVGTGSVMVVGAGSLSRFEGIGWVKAAALVGMLPVVTGCCVIGIPFGVWTLRLLNEPHIRERFERNDSPESFA